MVNPFNPGFTPNPFNVPQTITDMGKTMTNQSQATAPAQPMLNLQSLTQQGQQQNPAAWNKQWANMLATNPQAAMFMQSGSMPTSQPLQQVQGV